jgi:hypothetical protein
MLQAIFDTFHSLNTIPTFTLTARDYMRISLLSSEFSTSTTATFYDYLPESITRVFSALPAPTDECD